MREKRGKWQDIFLFDDHIAISVMFDNFSCAVTAKKTAKKFAALSELLLCLFSYFHCCGCAELASSLTVKKCWFGGRGWS